ncbi:MAG: RluA family pseudouridine synthase [Oscillospiraceae bacterium]|nr:RluA family pseudouridine synthase [Oscillospiraceae bacterium]MDY3792825.1 RluA family pseudouridine synthase [Oscillospiraceae bacterium]MDY6208915.1 RluA family pseudouridine synthase [Oscillospiraceae bacterium]
MTSDNVIMLTADETHSGMRIDKLLSACGEEISRSLAAKLIENGSVTVNGKTVSKSCTVNAGDEITAVIPEPQPLDVLPENIPLDIIYEDDYLLVVNKPKGMVVHPAAGNYTGTLVNALMYHCGDRLSSINGVIRPGIVHRIDKNTSGLLIVAKTDAAHTGLAAQIKEHSFTREYRAVICGRLSEKEGTVNAPIGRHPTDRKKMTVTEKNSKHAVTHYTVLTEYDKYSFIKLRLETGRTHQIRVHMAYIGHPVLGDDVYGKPFKGLDGQCLHAGKIGFVHPITYEYMEFESELPQYFCDVLRKIGDGETRQYV